MLIVLLPYPGDLAQEQVSSAPWSRASCCPQMTQMAADWSVNDPPAPFPAEMFPTLAAELAGAAGSSPHTEGTHVPMKRGVGDTYPPRAAAMSLPAVIPPDPRSPFPPAVFAVAPTWQQFGPWRPRGRARSLCDFGYKRPFVRRSRIGNNSDRGAHEDASEVCGTSATNGPSYVVAELASIRSVAPTRTRLKSVRLRLRMALRPP